MSWILSKFAQSPSLPGNQMNSHGIHGYSIPTVASSVEHHAFPGQQIGAAKQQQLQWCWHQAKTVMERTSSSTPNQVPRSASDSDIVIRCTSSMVDILIGDQAPPECDPELLDYFYTEQVLEKLLAWSRDPIHASDLLMQHQLDVFETLITHSSHRLLRHKQFVQPLLRLLIWCDNPKSEHVRNKLILVLHQLCVGITEYSEILDLLFDETASRDNKFLVFSLLIPYVHWEGTVGQQARDALLLIMSLSSRHEKVGIYIAHHSDFCPVLATGLSGLYSSLPRTITYSSDDWFQITGEDVENMPELKMFLNSLDFCNAVIEASHPVVCEQLLGFIHNGFLMPVIGPALHQCDMYLMNLGCLGDSEYYAEGQLALDTLKYPTALRDLLLLSSVEEVIAATAYFDMFLRRVTEPGLMKIFLKYILLGKMDDIVIIESLIDRIISPITRLCMVTIALFRTLVELNCEDVMFHLVFKYLVPCNHIMVSQQRSVNDVDFYCKDAKKLVSLIPSCCSTSLQAPSEASAVHVIEQTTQNSDNKTPVGTGEFPPSPTTSLSPFQRLQRFSIRKKKFPLSGSTSLDAFRNASPAENPSSTSSGTLSSSWQESCYTDYLQAARQTIKVCRQACSNWTSRYDGICAPISPQIRDSVTPSDERKSLPGSSVAGNNVDNQLITEAVDECNGETKDEKSVLNGASSKIEPTSDIDQMEPVSTVSISNDKPPNAVVNDDLNMFLIQLNRMKLAEELEITPSTDITSEIQTLLGNYSALLISESPVISPETKSSGEGRPASVNENQQMDILFDQSKDSLSISLSPKISKSEEHAGKSIQTNNASHKSASYTGVIASDLPTLGPFLNSLFSRLERMKQNTLYVNLQLTGLLARLACYPQPLLRSLLLSHTLVFQPSVKSLVQVLNTVKCRIEDYLCKVQDLEVALSQAQQYLIFRMDPNFDPRHFSTSTLLPAPVGRRSSTISEFLFGMKQNAKSPRLQLNASSAQFINRTGETSNSNTAQKIESKEIIEKKNAIYGAIVFKEFLKELAAISQEHSALQVPTIS